MPPWRWYPSVAREGKGSHAHAETSRVPGGPESGDAQRARSGELSCHGFRCMPGLMEYRRRPGLRLRSRGWAARAGPRRVDGEPHVAGCRREVAQHGGARAPAAPGAVCGRAHQVVLRTAERGLVVEHRGPEPSATLATLRSAFSRGRLGPRGGARSSPRVVTAFVRAPHLLCSRCHCEFPWGYCCAGVANFLGGGFARDRRL